MSFSDMMSSGRGPGVIGMAMALVVLLGFGILFMFAFDEGFQGGDLSDEAVIAMQAKEIESYNMSIGKGQATLDLVPARMNTAKELSALGLENQTLKQNIATLGEKLKQAEEAIVAKKQEFEDYKDEYRAYVRGKAKGTTIPELVTVKGEVFKQAKISEVTPIGMQIVHLDGQRRVAFEELPEAMRDYYQFDPSQKEKAAAVENQVREDHNRKVDEANKIADAEAEKQKLLDAEKSKANAQVKLSEKQDLLKRHKQRAKELNNTIQQEDRKKGGLKKTSLYKEQLGEINRIISDLESEIGKLKASL